jgi:predicted amidohydrolase
MGALRFQLVDLPRKTALFFLTAFLHCLVFLPYGQIEAEEVFRCSFDETQFSAFRHIWGDVPVRTWIAPQDGVGVGNSRAMRLQLEFPESVQHNLSYWSYELPQPVPVAPELESIRFFVKTNVPISLKIAISPYGFIYHGPGVAPSDQWQVICLRNAYQQLRQWCEGGGQSADGAWVQAVIVAVGNTRAARADVLVDDLCIEGPAGAAERLRQETLRRQTRKVRIAPISLIWDEGHRTLEAVLSRLDEAGQAGADLACLPEVCVDQPPEPIPGPTYEKIAEKAAQYKMLVVGNLREAEGDKWYVTSFLCDRQGRLIGKYRKSHCLPYELGPGLGTGFALGEDLPVFSTDIGPIGLKIGTDHYFPEIDMVLRRRGAKLIVWSTSPFPVRDEHMITLALQGRAVDLGVHYAVARYAGLRGYGGYEDRFSWTGTWPIGRAQVFAADGHTLADSGHGGGLALATIPAAALVGGVNPKAGLDQEGPFRLAIAAKDQLPPAWARSSDKPRTARVAVIECEPDIPRLLGKLDHCGRQKCDLVCLWEYVWYHNDEEVEIHRQRNETWLRQISEKAAHYRMYVVIAGELHRGFNEAILFDREGKELGRYTKIIQTTPKESKYYQAGDRVGIFDLDFGRVCVKICADVYAPLLDLVAGLHQVDLMLHPTQDAGPYGEFIRWRDGHRAVDHGYFLLRATSPCGPSDHRAYILDPWGMVLAASQHLTNNPPIMVDLQLDNRPQYFEWPEDLRVKGPYPDGYQQRRRPVAKGDLRAVLLQCRRPELYRPKE